MTEKREAWWHRNGGEVVHGVIACLLGSELVLGEARLALQRGVGLVALRLWQLAHLSGSLSSMSRIILLVYRQTCQPRATSMSASRKFLSGLCMFKLILNGNARHPNTSEN